MVPDAPSAEEWRKHTRAAEVPNGAGEPGREQGAGRAAGDQYIGSVVGVGKTPRVLAAARDQHIGSAVDVGRKPRVLAAA